jgi:iron(III) transport system substrate-binding protein
MRQAVAASAALLLMVSSAAAADWKDSPSVKTLYEGAKKEGQVMIWGPQARQLDWIQGAFGAVFPGVKVNFVGDNDVAIKAIAEARAGRHEVDTYWSSVTATFPLVQRDLLVANDWPAFGVEARDTAFDRRMGFSNIDGYIVAFVKGAVKPEDQPTKWEQLLEPKYKGKMVGSLFLIPRLVGGLSLAWGQERAFQFGRDLVNKTDFLLTKAVREPFLLTGERVFAAGEIDAGYRRAIMEGQNFEFTMPEPVVVAQFGPSVMAKAPHPNASRLLAGWLASADGRIARRKATGQIDYTASDDPVAKKINAGEVQVVRDLPTNMAQREEAIRKAGPIIAGQAQ